MRYTALAGGKRLFSTLCIAAFELVGGNESLVMPMACAMEMIVAAAIILDDLPCMDNDDFRQGKPTNNKCFGEGTSVLASQALSWLVIEHITTETENVSPDRPLRAVQEISLSVGSKGAVAGQIADISSEGKELSLSELEFIHGNKTGKLVEASVVSGGLVGGGNEVELERLRNYGQCVGLAHLVWDDVLDVSGTAEQLGKRAGRDLLPDKATYPKLIGIDESKKYVAQAHEELTYFDTKMAAPLYHIANFIVARQH